MLKNFLYLVSFALCSSCASTHKSSATRHIGNASSQEPKFLENITVRPFGGSKTSTVVHKPVSIKPRKDIPGSAFSKDIEKCDELQFKYAILMDAQVEAVTNKKLIDFLEEWYGVPYKYGGEGKTGIDCSAFSCAFMDSVYGIDLPRTCREQYRSCKHIKKDQLSQGDLVFFNTTGGVSHVGVYLGNNKFVHASSSSGIMISDLDDSYFKRRYVGAATVR